MSTKRLFQPSKVSVRIALLIIALRQGHFVWFWVLLNLDHVGQKHVERERERERETERER